MTATNLSIPALRDAVRGRVIVPQDVDYDPTRFTVSAVFDDRRPAAIVRAADVEDVRRVVTLARETGLELAIRNGGHSMAGHSTTDGGIVLDLRELKGLEIDPVRRIASAEGGLTAGEYTTAAAEYGLATGFGDTASVGISGITLGGGIGYLVRQHGLTIDNLIAAEIVTADGELRHVDVEHEPDLFWAIRGGGGNFGVVTRFTYRLHPVDTIVGGMLMLPATPEVIAGFIALADEAPEELSTIANVMTAPPMPFLPAELHGKLVLLALMSHAGDVEAGLRTVEPFRKLATPIADMLRPGRYPDMYPPEEGEYRPLAVTRTMFLDTLDTGVAQTIIDHLEASDAPMRVTQLRVLGGAMARVPSDATAFAHRSSRIMANLASFYQGPDDRARREAWIDAFATALRQDDQGAYVNFLGEEGEEGVRRAYPSPTWERLAAIKARYDPTNLFRLNQNIPPRADLEARAAAA
ncbi:MAG: FAD-binding oxidoreductase [Sphaerobacter thermophilus]|uniref:FAD-binding oxidoreductase n=1 Tax=Sphaerobacter thermophilus TaxID=2057 RepID=UPI000DB2ECF8|nr:MAG: FAD-linked oxidase [Sphaerobacter thermophilus]